MTIVQLLGLAIPSHGSLKGRVLSEALREGSAEVPLLSVPPPLESKPALNGLKTVLKTQVLGDQTYLDAAGFMGRTVGLDGK
jgi:hypothetical protein